MTARRPRKPVNRTLHINRYVVIQNCTRNRMAPSMLFTGMSKDGRMRKDEQRATGTCSSLGARDVVRQENKKMTDREDVLRGRIGHTKYIGSTRKFRRGRWQLGILMFSRNNKLVASSPKRWCLGAVQFVRLIRQYIPFIRQCMPFLIAKSWLTWQQRTATLQNVNYGINRKAESLYENLV